MDILAGLSGASQVIAIAQTLRAAEKSFDEATYKARMADLLSAATDAKLALAEAKDELAEKSREIARLLEAFSSRGDLVEGPGGYRYKTDQEGRLLGYPVCPKCEPLYGRIIQLKQCGGHLTAKCPACSETFVPVTCFLPFSEGAPRTSDDQAKVNQKIASEKLFRGYEQLNQRRY